MSEEMWTIWEFPRILEMYDEEYIIYDISDWKTEDANMIHEMFLNRIDYDGSTVVKKENGQKCILIRYVAQGITPKYIHVFTKDKGSKIVIPEDETIETFIQMYMEEK